MVKIKDLLKRWLPSLAALALPVLVNWLVPAMQAYVSAHPANSSIVASLLMIGSHLWTSPVKP